MHTVPILVCLFSFQSSTQEDDDKIADDDKEDDDKIADDDKEDDKKMAFKCSLLSSRDHTVKDVRFQLHPLPPCLLLSALLLTPSLPLGAVFK